MIPFCFVTFCYIFFETVFSLHNSGCPRNHSADYAGLEFRDLPSSASLLELKVCTTMPSWSLSLSIHVMLGSSQLLI